MFQRVHPWRNAPFIRLITPLIAGITCAWFIPLEIVLYPIPVLSLLGGTALILLLIICIRALSPNKITAILYFFIFLIGIFLTLFNDTSLRSDFAGRMLNDSSVVVFRLREPLVEKPATWKAEADILAVGNHGSLHSASGRTILYFQKKDSALSLHYGDVIITGNHLREITNTGNPGSFNYKRYCHLQNIFYQSYLPTGSWSRLPLQKAGVLKQIFLTCRTWCLNVIATFVPGEKERGVAEALLSGYRDNLDKELVQAYANVGVVHIIAISGLHLGLIYLILLFICRPIPDKKGGRWLKGTLVILALWCFTLITGAAPSALRAAVMFSFFAIAKFFIRRHPNKYNTLAASAFLLLCYDPFLLFDVGFQLSYLAVLGILLFQRPIFKLLVSRNRPLNYLWEMMSVSLAAELLIFPVALFYFHRFPVLFLIANLLIIPLSSFILYAEIILLIVAFIPPVAAWTGIVTGKSIVLMDGIITRINEFSFSSWSGISINLTEMFLLYGVVIMLAIWLMHQRKAALFAALLFLLGFSLAEMGSDIHTAGQRKIVVYNVSHHRAIDFVDGRSVHFMGDTGVLENKTLLRYSIIPSRIWYKTTPEKTLPHLIRKGSFIQYYDLRIALLDSLPLPPSAGMTFPVDYVLLSHDPAPDFRHIKTIFHPQLVIFDASNSWWKIEKWKTACKRLNLRCFSVPDRGAWVMDVE